MTSWTRSSSPDVVLPEHAALKVTQLSVSMKHGPSVLIDVSFTLKRGEIIVISGRSGVGKTVLFRAILGLLPEESWHVTGAIDVGGIQILDRLNGYQPKALTRVRNQLMMAVFQNPSAYLHPALSLGRQYLEMFPLRRTRWRIGPLHREIAERFRAAGLRDPESAVYGYPPNFAHGELQRVMVEMARERPFILADEPTSALDEENETRVIDLFAECRSKSGILIVTHNYPAFLSRLGDDGVSFCELRADRPEWPATLVRGSVDRPRPIVPPAPPDRGAPILSVSDLTLRVGRKLNLRGLSFDVSAGEFFAICGTSGTGKTTLAKAILGLVRPDAGRIECNVKAQLVFQNPRAVFNPRMTVRETLTEVLLANGVRDRGRQEEESVRLLNELGLLYRYSPGSVLESLPRRFSGGELQRLGIARSLLANPALLIADQPFSNLDLRAAHKLAELFCKLRNRDTGMPLTFIIIEHNRRLVESLCRRGIVINEDGSYSQWSSPRDGTELLAGEEDEEAGSMSLIRHLVRLGLEDVS